MQSAMLDHGLEIPKYIFKDGYFTVILQGPADNMNKLRINEQITTGFPVSIEEKLTRPQRAILSWLATGETMTNRECQKRLSVSKVTATKNLTALVKFGLAEKIGKGRNVRYVYRGSNR